MPASIWYVISRERNCNMSESTTSRKLPDVVLALEERVDDLERCIAEIIEEIHPAITLDSNQKKRPDILSVDLDLYPDAIVVNGVQYYPEMIEK